MKKIISLPLVIAIGLMITAASCKKSADAAAAIWKVPQTFFINYC